jgi:drug/metabolite transporter (DMT)-like permease
MALYPLLTWVLAVLFLGEEMSWLVLLGAVLIVGGVSAVAGEANPRRPNSDGDPSTRRRGVALVLGAAVAWSLAALWLSSGSQDLGALAAGGLRIPSAGLFLLGLAFFRRRRLPIMTTGVRGRSLMTVSLAGILGTGLGGLLYIAAVQDAGAGKAAILSSTSPLFVLPMAVLFLAERVTPRLLAGPAVSIVGIWLVV